MKAKFPYKKKPKRLGCGIGSGSGKTASKGHKGQRARSGYTRKPGFEGGQNPLYRRLPKRGFNNALFHKQYRVMNLGRLEEIGLKEISPEVLIAQGLMKNMKDGLKILGHGSLTTALTVKAHRFSGSAKEKIEKAGGQAIVLEPEEK